MLDKILALSNKQNSVRDFCSSIRQGIPLAVFGVCDSFKNYLLSVLEEKVLYVVKDNVTAHFVVQAIEEFSGKRAVYIPPKDEVLLMNKAFSKDNAYKRICAFSQMQDADVVIVTAETLMQSAPKTLYDLTLNKDQEHNQQQVITKLVEMGYSRVETVVSGGCFSVRGDILDIFPINSDNPYRIDFFGDTIETIKKYDAETRENLGYVSVLKILQATEFVFKNDDFSLFKSLLLNEIRDSKNEQKSRRRELFDDISLLIENKDYDALDVLSPLSKDVGPIFDLLPKDTVVIFDESKKVFERAT